MGKRIGPFAIGAVAVSLFLLLAASGAVGQNAGLRSASSGLESPSLSSENFPDSPSTTTTAMTTTRAALKTFEEARPVAEIRPNEFESIESPARAGESKTIFDKYLSHRPGPVAKVVDLNEKSSLVGRATHAAVGVFVTRDESGKSGINTSYFLRALTAVAADTASRPYWRRSAGEPLADFGSTMGNDAGLNVLHAFEPGLQQMMKSHTPRFVARIAEKVARN